MKRPLEQSSGLFSFSMHRDVFRRLDSSGWRPLLFGLRPQCLTNLFTQLGRSRMPVCRDRVLNSCVQYLVLLTCNRQRAPTFAWIVSTISHDARHVLSSPSKIRMRRSSMSTMHRWTAETPAVIGTGIQVCRRGRSLQRRAAHTRPGVPTFQHLLCVENRAIACSDPMSDSAKFARLQSCERKVDASWFAGRS